MKQKIRARSIRRFAFILCAAILVVASVYYLLFDKFSTEPEDASPTTEVGKLISKDLTISYPGTPREVMKMYCRVSQCLYNDSYSDSDYEKLAKMIYQLYSTDLAVKNPYDSFLSKLKSEVDSYKEGKKAIATYTVSTSSEVDYRKINNRECALVEVQFLMHIGSSYQKANEQFVLVNENDQWKILGFQKKPASEVKKENE